MADLDRYVMTTLSRGEKTDVVDTAISDIEYNFDQIAKRLNAKERGTHPGSSHFIEDRDLRKAVGRTLRNLGSSSVDRRSAYQVAHVLYGLATYGAIHYGLGGFNTALDVVRWLELQYDSLPRHIEEPHPRGRPVDSWWMPPFPVPTAPLTVFKKQSSSADGVQGAVQEQPFDRPRFVRSIRNALAGRGEEKIKSELIATWTLWGLVGQSVVLSSQLAAGVLDCLRRVDDVAYLRWAAISKGLSVDRVYQEAVGLVNHPSPQLRFDEWAQPRARWIITSEPNEPRPR